MKQEYFILARQLEQLIDEHYIVPANILQKYIAIATVMGQMHIILQEEHFALQAENALLRARLDADSPIGTIRNN